MEHAFLTPWRSPGSNPGASIRNPKGDSMDYRDCYGGCRVKLMPHKCKIADKQQAFGLTAHIEKTDGQDALVVEEVRGFSWWWPIEYLDNLPDNV